MYRETATSVSPVVMNRYFPRRSVTFISLSPGYLPIQPNRLREAAAKGGHRLQAAAGDSHN